MTSEEKNVFKDFVTAGGVKRPPRVPLYQLQIDDSIILEQGKIPYPATPIGSEIDTDTDL